MSLPLRMASITRNSSILPQYLSHIFITGLPMVYRGLPGSWEGKKFCVRWTTGGKNFYKGVTADPLNWKKGEWSELIPIS